MFITSCAKSKQCGGGEKIPAIEKKESGLEKGVSEASKHQGPASANPVDNWGGGKVEECEGRINDCQTNDGTRINFLIKLTLLTWYSHHVV